MSYKDNVELGSMESKATGIYKTTKIFLPLQYIYLNKKKVKTIGIYQIISNHFRQNYSTALN